jgi:hypothetical protein
MGSAQLNKSFLVLFFKKEQSSFTHSQPARLPAGDVERGS